MVLFVCLLLHCCIVNALFASYFGFYDELLCTGFFSFLLRSICRYIYLYVWLFIFIIIIDRFYIALFSALEQTHCARM